MLEEHVLNSLGVDRGVVLVLRVGGVGVEVLCQRVRSGHCVEHQPLVNLKGDLVYVLNALF